MAPALVVAGPYGRHLAPSRFAKPPCRVRGESHYAAWGLGEERFSASFLERQIAFANWFLAVPGADGEPDVLVNVFGNESHPAVAE